MTAQELIENRKPGSARCPAHDDRNASLSVGIGDDGRILLNCHANAGCTAESICAALGMKVADLFPEATIVDNRRNGHARPEIVATYDYTDEAGNLLFQVCRLEPKSFRQRHRVNGEWVWKMDGVRRVLYRLPEVVAAVKKGLPILIAEGEKDCIALAARGLVATCNPMGAGKWLPEYSECLRGANVVIVPDNDKAGREHAEAVEAALKGIARNVKQIRLPKGKDASDFFAAGGTLDELIEIIDTTKTFLEIVESRRYDPDFTPPAIQPVYSIAGTPIATCGNLQTITAHAKAGKSAVVGAQIASAFAIAGSDTLSFESENPKGLALVHIDTEHSIEDHAHFIKRVERRAGVEKAPAWLFSYCLTGLTAREARAALGLVLDIAAQACGGIHSAHVDGVADLVCDVNDAGECNEFVAHLHALAIKYHCPIGGIIHFNPNSEKTRGHLGSQLERKAETNLRIDKDGEVSTLWSEKQRRAPILKGTGPRFQWNHEAGMHVSVDSGSDAKAAEQRRDLAIELETIFQERPSMRYSELITTVKNSLRVSDRTAERKFKLYRTHDLIEKSFGNLYTRKEMQ